MNKIIKKNFRKFHILVYCIIVPFLLLITIGCVTSREIEKAMGSFVVVYAEYYTNYILPKIVTSVEIMKLVCDYEQKLQIAELNVRNITISFNRSRNNELLNFKDNIVLDGRTIEITKGELKGIISNDANDIKFNIKNADNPSLLYQQKGGFIGKFELTIDDGRKIKTKEYNVGHFDGKDMPLSKAIFDVYIGDTKQEQKIIYFEKVNKQWEEQRGQPSKFRGHNT